MMPIDALPDDLDALRALVRCLSSERDAAIEECRRVREQNDRLHHLLRQLQRAQFGRRSERLDHEQMQLALEDIETTIAEQDAQEDKNDTAETTAEAQRKKRCANRGSLPAHLPRIDVTLAPEIAACPCCHGVMHVIWEDTAERRRRKASMCSPCLSSCPLGSLVASALSSFRAGPIIVRFLG